MRTTASKRHVVVMLISLFMYLVLSETPAWSVTIRSPKDAQRVLPVRHWDWHEMLPLTQTPHRVWELNNAVFCFRGDTVAVNESLRNFAVIDSKIHEVVIRPGPGNFRVRKDEAVVHDWRLNLPGVFSSHRANQEKTTNVFAKYPSMTIFIWDEGGIKLDELQIPENLTLLELEDLRTRYLDGLKSYDKNVRGGAASLLGQVDSSNHEIVAPLVDLLEDESPWVRQNAATALYRMGKIGKVALPALRRGLEDDEERVREACERAIKRIENAEDDVLSLDTQSVILDEIGRFKQLHVER